MPHVSFLLTVEAKTTPSPSFLVSPQSHWLFQAIGFPGQEESRAVRKLGGSGFVDARPSRVVTLSRCTTQAAAGRVRHPGGPPAGGVSPGLPGAARPPVSIGCLKDAGALRGPFVSAVAGSADSLPAPPVRGRCFKVGPRAGAPTAAGRGGFDGAASPVVSLPAAFEQYQKARTRSVGGRDGDHPPKHWRPCRKQMSPHAHPALPCNPGTVTWRSGLAVCLKFLVAQMLGPLAPQWHPRLLLPCVPWPLRSLESPPQRSPYPSSLPNDILEYFPRDSK